MRTPQALFNFAGSVLFRAGLLVALLLGAGRTASALPGDLDTTFDPANVAIDTVQDVAIAPSGTVLVGGTLAGTNALGNRIQGVVLLGADGTLDTSFGVPGVVTRISALTAAPDGSVVCAGLQTNGLNAVVRRLTSTGAIDATLDHVASGALSPWIYTLARQTDGRVLVGGIFSKVDGGPRTNLFRIHTDGTIDESFKTNFTSGGGILALALQADGKILAGGYFTNVLGVARRGIARLNADGSVDNSFNPGTGVQGMVKSIAVQADGKILIGGHFFSVNGTLRSGLARLTAAGAVDTTFDPGSGAELRVGDESVDGPSVDAIAIQGDGRIVVAGQFATFADLTRPNLARLNWNGQVDETFDPGAGTEGPIRSMKIDASGHLVVGGAFTAADRVPRLGVARFLNDGTLPVLPTVVTPPADKTVTLGKSVSFTVAAIGTPALRYQWLKSGLAMQGQTNDTFTLPSASFADAGVYSVEVSNGAGTLTSTQASLTVNPAPVAPVITTDPIGAIVISGGSTTMTTAATGSKPLTWEWRLGNTLLGGATTDTLVLTNLTRDDAGNYTARAVNSAGTATSAAAVLSVVIPPESQTVRAGTNVTFTVRSFGTGPFTYQWLFEGNPLAGANKSSLTLSNVVLDVVGAYTVIVSNALQHVTTPAATLSVQMPPKITSQPGDLNAPEGSSPALTVGVSGSTPLTYQWRMQGTNLPGETAASLSFNPIAATHAGYYSVVISNAYGAVTSRIATVTVEGSSVARIGVGDGEGFAGGTVEVPVYLQGVGNENSASFTLSFDPALLTLESITNGTAIVEGANVVLNSNEAAAGRIGVLVAAPAISVFASGSNQLFTLRFVVASGLSGITSTSIGFTNTPVAPGLLSATVQPLTFTYQPGTISLEAGWEADLNPEPDGDSILSIEDLSIVGQIVAGLIAPADVSQFVRADCAPMQTRGDGQLAAADWTQAARYIAGLDSPVRAGGPRTAPATATLAESSDSPGRKLGLMNTGAGTRRLEVVIPATKAGGIATASVRLNATGIENTAGFSLTFNPARLRFLQSRPGTALGNGSSTVFNTHEVSQGRLGVLLGENAGAVFRTGAQEVVQIDFEVLDETPSAVAFGDAPVRREIVSSEVRILPATYSGATLEPVPAAVAPLPRIPLRQRSGALLMRWDAPKPGHYVLETSTDLQQWIAVTEWNVLSAATLEFTDPEPTRGNHRFYRVR